MSVASERLRISGDKREWMVPAGILLALAVSVVVAVAVPEQTKMPDWATENFSFIAWVNVAEEWLKVNYQAFTRQISNVIKWCLSYVEDLLLLSPWPVVALCLVLPALAYGGLRLAILTIVGVLFWGAMDMWDPAMETLSLMGLAVVLSVVFGVALGVLCSQSDLVESIVRPILDTMQTMPAFVYLIPAIFFFGIGGAPAILATMIYALPPVVRLTNLGIRQVPAPTIEAARSYGSTRLQILFKVQIPLALPSIMLGVNQTVMMALGLVVLATFIGAAGLGYEVWSALKQLNVGWSLEGGLSIVFMAIIFDRLSYAMSGKGKAARAAPPDALEFRLLPQSWDENRIARAIEGAINFVWQALAGAGRAFAGLIAAAVSAVVKPVSAPSAGQAFGWISRHAFLVSGLALIWAVWLFDSYVLSYGDYPSAWQFTLRGPVDDAVDWLVVNPTFIAITKGIRAGVYLYMLNPLVYFLTHLPWWYSIAVFGVVAWVSIGRGFAIITVLALLFVGATGLWTFAMETFASIIVSVLVCFLIGVPLGILAAYKEPVDTAMKPVLDAMQTMPTFVYLIPVLMFFGGNIVSAVIATVIYALPPVIRLTTLGLRQVPHEVDEVSSSYGSSPLQTLAKVKLPMAVPSIMMGLNQAVMMALAMQVITPLIGGRGLGHQVFDALNIADTGKGLQAGIGIVLLAIILDRLSQAWSKNQRHALGLD